MDRTQRGPYKTKEADDIVSIHSRASLVIYMTENVRKKMPRLDWKRGAILIESRLMLNKPNQTNRAGSFGTVSGPILREYWTKSGEI